MAPAPGLTLSAFAAARFGAAVAALSNHLVLIHNLGDTGLFFYKNISIKHLSFDFFNYIDILDFIMKFKASCMI
jgi:hypothetical protein